MRKTLDQLRTAAAMQQTQNVSTEYATLVKGTAAQIMIAGWGQTVALYLAKAKDDRRSAHYQVMEHLAQWLLRSGDTPDQRKTPDDLLRRITSSDGDTYRADTAEALAYLTWLKRFAAARLVEPDGNRRAGQRQPRGPA